MTSPERSTSSAPARSRAGSNRRDSRRGLPASGAPASIRKVDQTTPPADRRPGPGPRRDGAPEHTGPGQPDQRVIKNIPYLVAPNPDPPDPTTIFAALSAPPEEGSSA